MKSLIASLLLLAGFTAIAQRLPVIPGSFMNSFPGQVIGAGTNGIFWTYYCPTNFSATNITAATIAATSFITAGGGVTGDGTTGRTNSLAGQFNYLNLQYSTNCAWGGVQSNGTCGTTVTLKGFEEFVVSIGGTIVQLGDATTNLGHHISITCGGTAVSCGNSVTNAITTVSSQKIAGATKWTNTAVFSCTQLISDGSNWQLCGSRGN